MNVTYTIHTGARAARSLCCSYTIHSERYCQRTWRNRMDDAWALVRSFATNLELVQCYCCCLLVCSFVRRFVAMNGRRRERFFQLIGERGTSVGRESKINDWQNGTKLVWCDRNNKWIWMFGYSNGNDHGDEMGIPRIVRSTSMAGVASTKPQKVIKAGWLQ